MTRSVYLDHSATTPVDPRVLETMLPYFSIEYGNASSSHRAGRRAEQATEQAREKIAAVCGCHPNELIFTSGATESNNLALRGLVQHSRSQNDSACIITTPVEHEAVSRTVEGLADVPGVSARYLRVDRTGMVVDRQDEELLKDVTVASVIYANNEVGTVQDIASVAAMVHEHKGWLHVDAAQAAGQLPLDVNVLGVDLLSVSAHKFYGPKGVGFLYVRHGVPLQNIQTGGQHERGRRAGTLNTPLIAGMAEALRLAHDEQAERVMHLTDMRDKLIGGILQTVDGSQLTGHATNRLPSHASFVFDGIDANKLLMHLDMADICASSASACKTGNPEPSRVLTALGYTDAEARSSLRLTVGITTTADDIAYVVERLAVIIPRLRKLEGMLAI